MVPHEDGRTGGIGLGGVRYRAYLIFVISFTQAAFSNSKFYTQKLTKNTPKHSKMSMKSKIYAVFVFNLENVTPDRIFLHGHRPWCPWQLWGMLGTRSYCALSLLDILVFMVILNIWGTEQRSKVCWISLWISVGPGFKIETEKVLILNSSTRAFRRDAMEETVKNENHQQMVGQWT